MLAFNACLQCFPFWDVGVTTVRGLQLLGLNEEVVLISQRRRRAGWMPPPPPCSIRRRSERRTGTLWGSGTARVWPLPYGREEEGERERERERAAFAKLLRDVPEPEQNGFCNEFSPRNDFVGLERKCPGTNWFRTDQISFWTQEVRRKFDAMSMQTRRKFTGN